MQETHLGRMAVEYGLIDEETLCRCLELQERNTEGRALGEILVSEGCLTDAVLKRRNDSTYTRTPLRFQVCAVAFPEIKSV